MNFEHLVAVNDPGLPFLVPLSRSQVWAGLMHRVEDARPFLPGLDACEIVGRGIGWVDRRLHFGQAIVADRATYLAEEWVVFATAASGAHGGGELTIRIEEPEPGRLFLRFSYRMIHALGAEVENAAYEGFLRQAYEAADIETVQVIRLMAAPPTMPA
jgi:hypothetical protein